MLNFDELHLHGINAFTYLEFQRAKINGNAKIFLRNFSLYLLGHLQANNQRSENLLSLIRNFKGLKFNRFQKILKFPCSHIKDFRNLCFG